MPSVLCFAQAAIRGSPLAELPLGEDQSAAPGGARRRSAAARCGGDTTPCRLTTLFGKDCRSLFNFEGLPSRSRLVAQYVPGKLDEDAVA